MSGVWQVLVIMLGLIALYLLLFYSGGTTSLSTGVSNLLTGETKALQGR